MKVLRKLFTGVTVLALVAPLYAASHHQQSASASANQQMAADSSYPNSSQQSSNMSADQQSADMQAQAQPVDVNSASAQALAAIKGFSMKQAKAIIAYRDKHGKFSSVDDLSKVKGISKRTLAKVQNMLIAQ